MLPPAPSSVVPAPFPPAPWPQTSYRRGVGIVLLNQTGDVFAGQRRDHPTPHWQLPQGGIEPDEPIETALYRELEEETGIPQGLVSVLATAPRWVRYDLPVSLQSRLWGGRFLGQQQLWIALRFHGSETDIDIEHTQPPEFRAYAWLPFATMRQGAVDFKQAVYGEVEEFFGHLWS